jgi:5-methylcytosine-specific restriction enzyme A
MSRERPEWIGKTDDTPIPRRVKLRILENYQNKCGISGRPITPSDRVEFDHIIALANGGENREDNIQPVIAEAHREKTKRDVKIKAKIARVKARNLGIQQTKTKIPYRRFNGEPVWPK